ncbi:cytochrome c peroxidase [Arachidicoccus rhizosphaerae]|uniref:Cytochrome c peroxidase n=1 Tax=Arachidicoccus rhizosphaerae TaxID=551991 RepID=A0A1H4CW07_9BACT|nr:cytochrome c peroxidase [Arachidicoccus rhizosphaerae]SEA64568.1 cytochrome c peroxidase [Arachidicoccus rhizosphaerae]
MKKTSYFIVLIGMLTLCSAYISDRLDNKTWHEASKMGDFYHDLYSFLPTDSLTDSIVNLYQGPVSDWPKPNIDSGIVYQELGAMPGNKEYLKWDNDDTVKLGKILFFDPRLSRSSQISCSSCHEPDMAWQDGRTIALGNDHLQGNRNTPSLLNVIIQKELFWDGRAGSLESQATAPLAEHHEMDMDVKSLPAKLMKIAGYDSLFTNAYGNSDITLSKITYALASFEKTLRSKKSRFDFFVEGNKKALKPEEIKGLHLFRTKARCMNCHNGPYFTDLQYHNIGLSYYGRKFQDLGRYLVTGKKEDVGKFKTPTLRDLLHTRPWMHNGLFDNLTGVINIYNSGMHQLDNKVSPAVDSLYPHTDPILRPLQLTADEKEALVAFLEALNPVEYKMRRPELPGMGHE